MHINDFLGYKLKCKMSKGLEKEPSYNKNEFEVVLKADSTSDSGYTAVISGYDEENSTNYDGETIFNHFLFGDWDIISKERIN